MCIFEYKPNISIPALNKKNMHLVYEDSSLILRSFAFSQKTALPAERHEMKGWKEKVGFQWCLLTNTKGSYAEEKPSRVPLFYIIIRECFEAFMVLIL